MEEMITNTVTTPGQTTPSHQCPIDRNKQLRAYSPSYPALPSVGSCAQNGYGSGSSATQSMKLLLLPDQKLLAVRIHKRVPVGDEHKVFH
jgi:hypothetical protein